MKTINYTIQTFLLFSSILFFSCEKEAPELVEEQELITTVTLEFLAEGELSQTLRWQMDNVNPETATLKVNTPYTVRVAFLDESDPGDIEDITQEVQEEADVHQVFFEFSDLNIDFSSGASDVRDSQNNPLYLQSIWNATATGTGTVRVYLIHEPTSKTSTSRSGFGGDTDVAVDFPIRIVE